MTNLLYAVKSLNDQPYIFTGHRFVHAHATTLQARVALVSFVALNIIAYFAIGFGSFEASHVYEDSIPSRWMDVLLHLLFFAPILVGAVFLQDLALKTLACQHVLCDEANWNGGMEIVPHEECVAQAHYMEGGRMRLSCGDLRKCTFCVMPNLVTKTWLHCQ